MNKVIVQKWKWTKGSWGEKPDGYSLHINHDARDGFVREYWANMPEIQLKYSIPDGSPYAAEVDDKTFAEVKASKNGVRFTGPLPLRERAQTVYR